MHPPVRNSELGDFSKLLGPVVSGNSGHISITRGACPHPDQFIRTSWGGGRGLGREQQPGMSIFENCLKNSNAQVSQGPPRTQHRDQTGKGWSTTSAFAKGAVSLAVSCMRFTWRPVGKTLRTKSTRPPLGSGDAITFEKSTNYNSIIQQEATCEDHSPMKRDPVGSPLSEFRRCPFLEQELAKKYSCNVMAFLADEYCNYCRDILRNVRNQELERVEDLLTSFWKSLQQDTVVLMSLPDVCQLFKCYDVQLYKGIEDVLLHDFLEDVSIQYLKSVRLFSKKLKLWLLNALEGFPALLQISKLKGRFQ
ncbi:DNA-binding protein RFX8 isoform X1 [Macaca fascicularis]|uniref:DNA-binding protein RFX8 isoform X1 n=1 Tax=Macaca fascicularis TaxID=9541 RepID=UPI0032B0304B